MCCPVVLPQIPFQLRARLLPLCPLAHRPNQKSPISGGTPWCEGIQQGCGSPWSWNLTNVDADAFPSAMNDPRWTTPMDFAGFVGGKSAKECTIINNTIWSQKGTSKDHLITEIIRRNFVATKFCGTNLEPNHVWNLLQRRWCTDQVGFVHRVESSCHFSVVANERMLSPTTLYQLLIK